MDARLCYPRKEAAAQLGISLPQLDNLIRQKRIAAFRIGTRAVRVPAWSLEKYISEATEEGKK